MTAGAAPKARRRTAHGVVRADIDGVPAFWPAEAVPGPLSAALVFRIGQADETLPLRGVTHLVEHLALARTPWGAHDFNGTTTSTTTSFSVSGEPEQVRDYLAQVSASLDDLPVQRLPQERQVLRTEEAGRSGAARVLWRMRWGARGPGLLGYDELGLLGLQEDAALAWAHEHFVRQRAVLMLSGPPPRRLALPLRDGTSAPELLLPPPVDQLPAHFVSGPGGCGLSWTAERSAASRAASWLVGVRLADRLRRRDGLVYGVSSDSDPLTPTVRHEVLWTACLPENAAAVATALLEVLEELRADGGWSDEERSRYLAMVQPDAPGAAAGYAAYLALAQLTGDAPRTPRQLTTEVTRLRPDDVAEALQVGLTSLLLALPEELPVPDALAAPIQARSSTAVSGRALVAAHGQATRLLLADHGISVVDDEGPQATVLFAQCRAMLCWDDGARSLLGEDGFAVAYWPEQWRDDRQQVATALDAAVPSELRVPVGEREPLANPSPPDPWRRPLAALRAVGLVLTSIMAVFMAALTLVVAGEDASTSDRVLGVLLSIAFTAATAAWPLLELRRALRRRRGGRA